MAHPHSVLSISWIFPVFLGHSRGIYPYVLSLLCSSFGMFDHHIHILCVVCRFCRLLSRLPLFSCNHLPYLFCILGMWLISHIFEKLCCLLPSLSLDVWDLVVLWLLGLFQSLLGLLQSWFLLLHWEWHQLLALLLGRLLCCLCLAVFLVCTSCLFYLVSSYLFPLFCRCSVCIVVHCNLFISQVF